jgi:hypothetical protein
MEMKNENTAKMEENDNVKYTQDGDREEKSKHLSQAEMNAE